MTNRMNLRPLVAPFAVLGALTLTLASFDGMAGVEPSPFLSGVEGIAYDDVWAVGEAGAIWHWDGRRWTPVESPTKRDLNAVFVAGSDEAWAVGDGVIIRWNEHEWVMGVEPSPFLNDISGVNSEDIWAVGNGGVAMHYDGREWSKIETGFEVDLYGVWVGRDGAWAVGDGAIISWNEHDWVMGVEPSPFLSAISGTSSENLWAVGGDGVAMYFNGEEWSEIETGFETHLYGVWATRPDDVWAVGEWGTVLHFDGEQWNDVDSGTERGLNDIWASWRGAVWAVGDHVVWTP